MKAKLFRLRQGDESTIGALFINDTFECFTLENIQRCPKVIGETRIPSGTYVLKLRTNSLMARKYNRRFDYIDHKGMIWLQGVPGFEHIYLHVGNSHEDTSGCILVGDDVDGETITNSAMAYRKLYSKFASIILAGQEATLEIIDSLESA